MYQDHLLALAKGATAAPSTTFAADVFVPSELDRAKLPPVVLPSFSGDIQEWVRFKDTFTEMVLKRANLPPVYKMHYLRTALTGEAADLLEEIPPSGDHFDEACTTLKDFYNNPWLLVTRLLSKLLALKLMTASSAHEVNMIRSHTKNILQALEALGSPVGTWDHFIVFLTVSKLTPHTQRKWEEHVAGSDEPQTPPSFESLDKFLDTERLALVQLDSAKEIAALNDSSKIKQNNTSSSFKEKYKNVKSVNVVQEEKPVKSYPCFACKGDHHILQCDTFRSKPPTDRKKIVMEKRRCLNCLAHHFIQDCKSFKRCQQCYAKHHTMLHFDSSKSSITQQLNAFSKAPGQTTIEPAGSGSSANLAVHNSSLSSSKAVANMSNKDTVLLATARIYIHAKDGRQRLARAMIDQGAQSSFISEELCQYLKLPRKPVRISISGIGEGKTFTCKSEVTFTVKPHFLSTFTCGVTAFVVPRITAYDPFTGQSTQWTHLQGITLADSRFAYSERIDVLLGAQVHALIVEKGLRKGDAGDSPIATKTYLGWIVSGPTSPHIGNRARLSANLQVNDVELNEVLRRFWEIEETPSSQRFLTEEEKLCEEFFKATVSRNKDGRYLVRLPFKDNVPSNWEGSYSLALRMLRSLERKFDTKSDFHQAYVDSMREYLTLGHMRQAPNGNLNLDSCFFLPHHGVVKESSTTTKLRTVFNASARTRGGSSLNDFLLVGPNSLSETVDLLTRWRRYPSSSQRILRKCLGRSWCTRTTNTYKLLFGERERRRRSRRISQLR